jgi:mono/diheme cytochrome c family protein
MKNPVAPTPQSVDAGKASYEDNCLMCHGEKGAGDGIAGKSLPIKPADFTDTKLMKSETDGSLFWKMTTGRGAMPAWKDTLSDTQRWQLVNYIRTFVKGGAEEKDTAPSAVPTK